MIKQGDYVYYQAGYIKSVGKVIEVNITTYTLLTVNGKRTGVRKAGVRKSKEAEKEFKDKFVAPEPTARSNFVSKYVKEELQKQEMEQTRKEKIQRLRCSGCDWSRNLRKPGHFHCILPTCVVQNGWYADRKNGMKGGIEMAEELAAIKREIRSHYSQDIILTDLKDELAARIARLLAEYGVKETILKGRIKLINEQIRSGWKEAQLRDYWNTWLDKAPNAFLRPGIKRIKTQTSLLNSQGVAG